MTAAETLITLETVEEHTLLRPSLIDRLREHGLNGGPWLHNPSLPEHGVRAAIWMHGTLGRFQTFRTARRHEHYDWDGRLGTHFTSSAWAAQMYAIGEFTGRRPRAGGRVAACLLQASSPATFEFRSQVTVSALRFALKEKLVEPERVHAAATDWQSRFFGPFALHAFGYGKKDFPRARDALLRQEEPPGKSLQAGYVIAMEVLNESPEVAAQYVDHLRSQGFDSILCNLADPVESVAIVFDSKQILLLEWQPAWDAVLVRVRHVRGERGDKNIQFSGLIDTVQNARRVNGKRVPGSRST